MPPKPKFSKEEIVKSALSIVSKKGVEALTAKELGLALGTSSRPIFTFFKTMQELKEEVKVAAMTCFESYTEIKIPDTPLFKQVGMQMVMFGINEPKLFQLLFMQENRSAVTFDDVFKELGSTAERCVEALRRDYGLSFDKARLLFENVWLYTFGLGVLCATRMCHFSEEELSTMLTTQFNAMMLLVCSEEK